MIISAEKKKEELSAITVLKDVFSNKELIRQLAKNDFKKKFAGSYFGVLWAFVSPIVTICVYWFVFTVGMRGAAADVNGYPYVLWMITGLVPWFLFSEIVNSGTNVFVEYTYLVKKIVFNISLLPVVKIVTATIIHLFFIVLTLTVYICCGFMPGLYALQIIYYMVALWIFAAGVIFMTSAIVVFFKDLTQAVTIFLQVFIWITPIMWQDSQMLVSHPIIAFIIKLNPMYYIVNGYRDALINHVWFWERTRMTPYFWIVTIIMFIIGTAIFNRLRPHFADVI